MSAVPNNIKYKNVGRGQNPASNHRVGLCGQFDDMGYSTDLIYNTFPGLQSKKGKLGKGEA